MALNMSIFDQIGKKISDVSSSAVDTAKNLAETQKLNNEINSSNKNIEKIYREIGQKFYEAHKEEAFGEYGEQIQEITAIKTHIEDLKVQIDILKSEREAARAASRAKSSKTKETGTDTSQQSEAYQDDGANDTVSDTNPEEPDSETPDSDSAADAARSEQSVSVTEEAKDIQDTSEPEPDKAEDDHPDTEI